MRFSVKIRALLVVFLSIFGAFLVGVIWAASLEDQISKAKSLYDNGKFKESALAYKEIITEFKEELKSNDEKVVEVWQSFGEALQKSGHADLAQKAFDRAANHRKKSAKYSKRKSSRVLLTRRRLSSGKTPSLRYSGI
ncbi:hypothetical protein HYY75_00530 [bacterium]|nr:hypothetical protein [bacterium]